MELFGSRPGRSSAILALLASPWIVRGSDVAPRDQGAGSKSLEEAADVEWDGERRCPVAFRWRGRGYAVDAVVQTWAVERRWWSPSRRVSRRCFRVLASGGVYDLAYDRLGSRWLLLGVAD